MTPNCSSSRTPGSKGRFPVSSTCSRASSLAPAGTTLAISSGIYWNKQFQRDLLTIQGFGTSVQCVVFSPDGKRLATACLDGTVKVCDAFTAQEVLLFKADRLGVNSVAYSPDGQRLASGGKEKTVKVWDAASGQQVASCRAHTGEIRSVAFSPDGLRLASAGGIFDPKGVVGPDITMWNAATGNEVFSTPGHKGGVSGVAFSPDGKTLASSGSPWDPVTRKTGGEVGLWSRCQRQGDPYHP